MTNGPERLWFARDGLAQVDQRVVLAGGAHLVLPRVIVRKRDKVRDGKPYVIDPGGKSRVLPLDSWIQDAAAWGSGAVIVTAESSEAGKYKVTTIDTDGRAARGHTFSGAKCSLAMVWPASGTMLVSVADGLFELAADRWTKRAHPTFSDVWPFAETPSIRYALAFRQSICELVELDPRGRHRACMKLTMRSPAIEAAGVLATSGTHALATHRNYPEPGRTLSLISADGHRMIERLDGVEPLVRTWDPLASVLHITKHVVKLAALDGTQREIARLDPELAIESLRCHDGRLWSVLATAGDELRVIAGTLDGIAGDFSVGPKLPAQFHYLTLAPTAPIRVPSNPRT